MSFETAPFPLPSFHSSSLPHCSFSLSLPFIFFSAPPPSPSLLSSFRHRPLPPPFSLSSSLWHRPLPPSRHAPRLLSLSLPVFGLLLPQYPPLHSSSLLALSPPHSSAPMLPWYRSIKQGRTKGLHSALFGRTEGLHLALFGRTKALRSVITYQAKQNSLCSIKHDRTEALCSVLFDRMVPRNRKETGARVLGEGQCREVEGVRKGKETGRKGDGRWRDIGEGKGGRVEGKKMKYEVWREKKEG